MRYTHTNVRHKLHYTQVREFTGVIFPHTAMIFILFRFVILQLIIKIFFCFIYHKMITCTCILKILENVIILPTFLQIPTYKLIQSKKDYFII